MTLVKVLLTVWGVSLTASWWLYAGEVDRPLDRALVGAATVAGLAAIALAVIL